MEGLGKGRTVYYVLAEHDLPDTHTHCVGETIPTTVVKVWPGDKNDGRVNLTGFPDGEDQGLGTTLRLTSRYYSAEPLPGTWHWPPRV